MGGSVKSTLYNHTETTQNMRYHEQSRASNAHVHSTLTAGELADVVGYSD